MCHHIPQATYPNPVRVAPLGSYLVLLRAGFTVPQTVTSCAVRSYRTLSPLPAYRGMLRRFTFCCTFRGLTPPRRYLALYPVEPGLSSPMHQTALKRTVQLTPKRLSGRLRAATVTARKKKCKGQDATAVDRLLFVLYLQAGAKICTNTQKASKKFTSLLLLVK